MALSLGVQKGKQIRIAGKLLTVRDILASNKIRVFFEDKDILVTDLERTKLMEDVFISAGCPDDGFPYPPNYTRLAFEAPRAIRIERIPDRRAA